MSFRRTVVLLLLCCLQCALLLAVLHNLAATSAVIAPANSTFQLTLATRVGRVSGDGGRVLTNLLGGTRTGEQVNRSLQDQNTVPRNLWPDPEDNVTFGLGNDSQPPAPRGSGPLLCATRWHSTSGMPPSVKRRHARQGCEQRQTISCTGKRLPRALVIYMLHTKDSANDMAVEMSNFLYFMSNGVFGADEATTMFSGVDYIFTRMMPRHLGNVAKPKIIAHKHNIKLMWVPHGPCDLCAHGRVIADLGGADAVKAKYSFITMLNAGARGPFQAANEADWIDVMAIGGQTTWSEITTPPLMVGPSVSTQISPHVQSHVIAVHTKRLVEYTQFLSHCSMTDRNAKDQCIMGGEVAAGMEWLRGGGWIYGMARNVTLRSTADAAALSTLHEQHRITEPLMEPYDLCSALFSKFGGTFTMRVRSDTAANAAQLTIFQPSSRTLAGRKLLRRLLATCDFLEM
jgi:hypothetical protein